MANNYPLSDGTIYTAEMANKAVRASVRFGCRIDQGSNAADLVLDLKAGEVYCDGEVIAFSATTQTISAADATNPRWDLIGLKVNTTSNTLTKVYYQGTAAASPSKPTTAAADEPVIPLAYVYVAANDTAITNSEIYDARPMMGDTGVPLGTILMIHKSMTNVPARYPNYQECDGTAISHEYSPMSGGSVPNIIGSNYFLYGSGTSGVGKTEDYVPSHTHSYTGENVGGGTAAFQLGVATPTTFTGQINNTTAGTAWVAFSMVPMMRIW